MADIEKGSDLRDKPDEGTSGAPKKKKLSKKQMIFVGALGAVVIFALIRRKEVAAQEAAAAAEEESRAESEETGYYFDPIPVSGGVAAQYGTSGFYDNQNYYSELWQSEYEKAAEKFQDITGRLDEAQQNAQSIGDINAELEHDLSRERAIRTMMGNSMAWHTADDEGKQALHEENMSIADPYGFTYDGRSGKWYTENGMELYSDKLRGIGPAAPTIPTRQPKPQETYTPTAAQSQDKYEQIRSQMQRNHEAWHKADPAQRKALEAENKRLGKEAGMTLDSKNGVWSKDGKKVLA